MARIAVVDDNEDVLAITGSFLRRTSNDVILYSSPENLVRDIQQGAHLDLVISDFYMFGMNGAELLDSIKALGKQIPAIIMTGHPEGAASCAERVPIVCKGSAGFFDLLLTHVKESLKQAQPVMV